MKDYQVSGILRIKSKGDRICSENVNHESKLICARDEIGIITDF